jgi:hypothetical protein
MVKGYCDRIGDGVCRRRGGEIDIVIVVIVVIEHEIEDIERQREHVGQHFGREYFG